MVALTYRRTTGRSTEEVLGINGDSAIEFQNKYNVNTGAWMVGLIQIRDVKRSFVMDAKVHIDML